MTTRERLHALVDELPDDALADAEVSLRAMGAEANADGMAYDDETWTDEDAARWDELIKRPGQVFTTAEVREQLRRLH